MQVGDPNSHIHFTTTTTLHLCHPHTTHTHTPFVVVDPRCYHTFTFYLVVVVVGIHSPLCHCTFTTFAPSIYIIITVNYIFGQTVVLKGDGGVVCCYVVIAWYPPSPPHLWTFYLFALYVIFHLVINPTHFVVLLLLYIRCCYLLCLLLLAPSFYICYWYLTTHSLGGWVGRCVWSPPSPLVPTYLSPPLFVGGHQIYRSPLPPCDPHWEGHKFFESPHLFPSHIVPLLGYFLLYFIYFLRAFPWPPHTSLPRAPFTSLGPTFPTLHLSSEMGPLIVALVERVGGTEPVFPEWWTSLGIYFVAFVPPLYTHTPHSHSPHIPSLFVDDLFTWFTTFTFIWPYDGVVPRWRYVVRSHRISSVVILFPRRPHLLSTLPFPPSLAPNVHPLPPHTTCCCSDFTVVVFWCVRYITLLLWWVWYIYLSFVRYCLLCLPCILRYLSPSPRVGPHFVHTVCSLHLLFTPAHYTRLTLILLFTLRCRASFPSGHHLTLAILLYVVAFTLLVRLLFGLNLPPLSLFPIVPLPSSPTISPIVPSPFVTT